MLLIIIFAGTFAFLVSAGLLLFYRDSLLDRLPAVIDPQAGSSWNWVGQLLRGRPDTMEAIVKPFQNVVPRSQDEISVIQKRLIRAGYRTPGAVNVFYSAKVLVPISLALLATITQV